jgi:hypothetical protein
MGKKVSLSNKKTSKSDYNIAFKCMLAAAGRISNLIKGTGEGIALAVKTESIE